MKRTISEKEENTKHFTVLVKKIVYGGILISLVGFVAYTLLFLLMYFI